MTLKELRDKIKTLTAKKQEVLNNLEVVINYPHLNLNKDLKGFVDIYRFVQKQHNGWGKLGEVSPYLQTSPKYFSEIFKKLNSYIQDDFGKSFKGSFHNDLKEAIQDLEKDNARSRGYDDPKFFTYDAPETFFLLKLHNINPNSVETAIKVLTKQDLNRVNLNFDNYTGIQKAFEFLGQGDGRVRVEAETKSIELLKNNFDTQIDDANVKLETTIEKYNSWLSQTQKSFQDFDKKSKQTIKDKEELYTEKLKLSAPAAYWRERATKLRTEGNRWMYFLIAVTVIAVVMLGMVLFFISDGTLKDLFEKSGSAIRWSLVFITFVSFLAFTIRTFAKLMFSAYHLVRDAEERQQLAFVYLALKQDKNIDDKERHLVLQSLFSRADTGLLKADAAPTMPGNSIDKLMK